MKLPRAALAGLMVPSELHDFIALGQGSRESPLFIRCRRCRLEVLASGEVRHLGSDACES